MIRLQPDDPGSVVLCPRCGGDYLHHGRVEVFDRVEDAATGLRTVLDRGAIAVSTDVTPGNPSPRRQGLRVGLFCEFCHGDSELVIYQHKGRTFIDAGY